MMEKFLGQDIENLQERERFLKDNAETVESISYDKLEAIAPEIVIIEG